jgi:hypothetical protein
MKYLTKNEELLRNIKVIKKKEASPSTSRDGDSAASGSLDFLKSFTRRDFKRRPQLKNFVTTLQAIESESELAESKQMLTPIVESSFSIHQKISSASSNEDVQVIEALRDEAQKETVSDKVLSTIDENIEILTREAQKLKDMRKMRLAKIEELNGGAKSGGQGKEEASSSQDQPVKSKFRISQKPAPKRRKVQAKSLQSKTDFSFDSFNGLITFPRKMTSSYEGNFLKYI